MVFDDAGDQRVSNRLNDVKKCVDELHFQGEAVIRISRSAMVKIL